MPQAARREPIQPIPNRTKTEISSRKTPDQSPAAAFYRTYRLMQIGFVATPLIAGLDKFFNLLVDWPAYLAPVIPSILNISPQGFMFFVGVVEVVAAIGVALRPRIFGYVVSAWLMGIVVNLVIAGGLWDIALRDLGLAISAFSLARLARFFR